ncbi:MAG: DUF177 domain-containing protein [Hyphomicrobiaceae bacterium]|nr:DUF177 domain-containing protein [Hyphomicrobiaceae bacterium]
MAELDWTVAVRDVPAGGVTIERIATSDERAGLAAALEILGIESLTLKARLRPRAGGRFMLEADLQADVTQACVVTLDPVATRVEGRLEIDFRPADTIEEQAEEELTGSALDEPDVEPIENGVIDLGRIVYEELASRLDPYPRAPGAELERTEAGPGADAAHPFARLAVLKRPVEEC